VCLFNSVSNAAVKTSYTRDKYPVSTSVFIEIHLYVQ
jgi:hypothetical protein